MKQIPWNKEITESLVQLVIQKGGHVTKQGKSQTQIWNGINHDFFNLEEISFLKAEHYKENDFRKIREKFKKAVQEAQAFIETANKSGKHGDLSNFYKLCEQAHREAEAMDAQEEKAVADKENIQKNEDIVLGGKFKQRRIDGALVDTSRPKPISFDEKMLSILEGPKKPDEAKVEASILAWLEAEGLHAAQVAFNANLNAEAYELLADAGVKACVNMYLTFPFDTP